MIKLVKNELIKIFKRKSIFLVFIITLVAIIVYNYINPDQNEKASLISTSDVDIELLEKNLEYSKNDVEQYVKDKTTIDLMKIYNQYEKDSWQRRVLYEEFGMNIAISGVNTDYKKDIRRNLEKINDYELNNKTKITKEDYVIAKQNYEQYIETLETDNYQNFLSLKVNNLKKIREKVSQDEKMVIDVCIKTYELRLNNNIEYKDDILNEYLKTYEEKSFMLLSKDDLYSQDEIKQNKETIKLCEYAIENRIEQDISPADRNIIMNNKMDARSNFLRTFEHFDLILIIIAIYVSCSIITEEVSKGTIKNLLTKPHKRSTILLSKLVACIITVLIFAILIILTQYFVGGIIFGFDSYNLQYIGYNHTNEQLFTMNLFNYIILVGLTKIPMYVFIITFCIFMGTINNNTAMNIILIIIIYIISISLISEWSKVEEIGTIAKYFVTNNWDFSTYLFGKAPVIENVSLPFSIVVYMVYECLFLFWGMKLSYKDI